MRALKVGTSLRLDALTTNLAHKERRTKAFCSFYSRPEGLIRDEVFILLAAVKLVKQQRGSLRMRRLT